MLSIVVPNYFMGKPGRIVPDGDEELWFALNCISRIKTFTKDYELILIDNGSVHGSEVLEDLADVYIHNETNLGFAKACNQGFKIAKGDWICCINNDVFVYEGWIEALIKTFEDNPDCGVAMPALMKQTKNGKEALTMIPDLTQNFGLYGKGAEFGSCWLTKREILDKVRQINNGEVFDEQFMMGMGEDRNLWRQIRQLGYDTYRTHNTRVFHQGNVTINKIDNRRHYTIPNREYLRRIITTENTGKTLTLEDKEEIKKQVNIDYEHGLLAK